MLAFVYKCESSLQFVLSQVQVRCYFELITPAKLNRVTSSVVTNCLPLLTASPHAYSALPAIFGFSTADFLAVNVYCHI
jgi:hypothetical protein